MEYNPWNIALRGARQGEYQMSTLGPYDYWAVEYGYREFAPDDEAAELARDRRALERAACWPTPPTRTRAFARSTRRSTRSTSAPTRWRMRRSASRWCASCWERTEARELKPGESYSVLRRNFTRGLAEASQGALYAAKYIGGLTTLRDRAGSGREPLTPVASTSSARRSR